MATSTTSALADVLASANVKALQAEYTRQLAGRIKFSREYKVKDAFIKASLATELKALEARKAPVEKFAKARHTAQAAALKAAIASLQQ